MSEQDKINISDKITEGIRKAQQALFEHKAKLGESVVIADENGQPLTVKAEDFFKTRPPIMRSAFIINNNNFYSFTN